MPDLHEVMSPVWEVWLKLKPEELAWHIENDDCLEHWSIGGTPCSDETATALCIAAMVEGLAAKVRGPFGTLGIQSPTVDPTYIVYSFSKGSIPDFRGEAPTLVEALAAACIAVKEAQEVSDAE